MEPRTVLGHIQVTAEVTEVPVVTGVAEELVAEELVDIVAMVVPLDTMVALQDQALMGVPLLGIMAPAAAVVGVHGSLVKAEEEGVVAV